MSDTDRNESNSPSDNGYNSMTQVSQIFDDSLQSVDLFHSTPINLQSCTSEQLAWEFRRARDKLETASNISEFSNISDRPNSNLSSISDVTGYEEELFRIKRLLGSDDELQVHRTFKKPTSTKRLSIEPTVDQLQFRIEELFSENEQLKIEIRNTEERIQLLWHQKFQDIARQKAHVDGQLIAASARIEGLSQDRELLLDKVKGYEVKIENGLHHEIDSLNEQLQDAQNINLELQKNVESTQATIGTWVRDYKDVLEENEKLRVALKNSDVNLDSKCASVQSLKEKIAEQYFQIQTNQHDKFTAETQNSGLRNELDTLKKSVAWYVEQLHACQNVKKHLQNELIQSQTKYIEQSRDFETNKIEIGVLSQKINQITEKSMHEKELLVKRLQGIQIEMVEREALLLNEPKIQPMETDDEKLREISEKIRNFEKVICTKNNMLEKYEKDHKELIVRITTLQKCLNDKEISEQTSINSCRNVKSENEQLQNTITELQNEISTIRNEKKCLQVALNAAVSEKLEIDTAVNKLRDDFLKMTQNYEKMKQELNERNAVVSNLESEKQNIFMEKNWKVCEIEHLHTKILDAKILKAELVEMTNNWNEALNATKQQEDDNELLKSRIGQLEIACKDLDEKIIENQELTNILAEVQNKNDTNETLIAQLQKQLVDLAEIQNKHDGDMFEMKYLLTNREKQVLEKVELIQELESTISRHEQLIQSVTTDKDNAHSERINSEQSKNQLQQKYEQATDELKRYEILIEQYYKLFCNMNDGKVGKSKSSTLSDLSSFLNELTDCYAKLNEYGFVMEPITTIQPVTVDSLMTYLKQFKVDLNNCMLKMGQQVHELETDMLKSIKSEKIFTSVGVQTNSSRDEVVLSKIIQLKTIIRANEIRYNEKYKRFENNNRTLLKTIKDHMRGRKLAEKSAEVLKQINSEYKLREEGLKLALESLQVTANEYKCKTETLQDIVLDLEREVGKYDLTANGCTTVTTTVGDLMQETFVEKLKCKFEIVESRFKESQEHINALKSAVSTERNIVNDLNQKLFAENHECCTLKKEVSTLKQEIERLSTICEFKNKEIEKAEHLVDTFRMAEANKSGQLMLEQENNMKLTTEINLLKQQIEIYSNQENLLRERIETIERQLETKAREFQTRNDNFECVIVKYEENDKTLKEAILHLKDDLVQMNAELDSVRREKSQLQQHCAQLRVALQGAAKQNQMLKERLRDSCEVPPDITSNLPSPTKYDVTNITRLLELNSVTSNGTPLANLQSCLDSLKDEINSLQQQVTANTSVKFR